jgi:DNA-binding NarL/FixJ family response regulator
MEDRKSVIIIDQHPTFRKGLKDLVERTPPFRFVAEAGSGREGMDLAREMAPDFVIMDYHLPDMNGTGVMRELKRLSPSAKILVLSASPCYDHVTGALRAGARGFAVKHAIDDSFVEAMGTLDQGSYFLDDEVYQEVLIRMLTASA